MTMSKALVFDIKRFAVNDGAGIRTTVFLKGCPLRCRWCQNPEGLTVKRRVIYFKDKCIHCQLCHLAQKDRISYQDRPLFDPEDQLDAAITACPTNALRYDSVYWEIPDLVEKIKEDKVFFTDGGGVTFSGGEPFMQFEALKALLHQCHEEGIHTAIETSLNTLWENVASVLPDLDFMYCDLKIYDENRHRQATGISNKQIIYNIRTLLESPFSKHMTVRTPLIPGYTATDDNIGAIASFLSGCNKEVHYELLNYNPLASAKYDLTDFTYGVDKKEKAFDTQTMAHFQKVAKNHGISHLVV